jgi:hypothetical protein
MVNMPGGRVGATRYERILVQPGAGGGLAARMGAASRAARAAVVAVTEHEEAICDVAAGVAAPALAGCVVWVLREARSRGVRRLRFLSRDGQVLYELARRIAPRLDIDLDLEYVYSSRLTWSLAATDPGRLAGTAWLFNSFVKSSAADVCARLGLPIDEFGPGLRAASTPGHDYGVTTWLASACSWCSTTRPATSRSGHCCPAPPDALCW